MVREDAQALLERLIPFEMRFMDVLPVCAIDAVCARVGRTL